jgi:uncharacterized protein (DUF4213/DUF364 family)
MTDPLHHFYQKHGLNVSNIKKIVSGEKYSAVLLKNGNIGVCANLSNQFEVNIEELNSPDLNRMDHRIIITAYFNARLNYLNNYDNSVDIFEGINYKKHKNIVMIGLFKPVLKKFKDKNITVAVFDMIKKNSQLTPLNEERENIQKADLIILSATTIFNGTFMEIVNSTGKTCDIFLLGPSSIMDRDMFECRNIKKIFGSIFESHDQKVLDSIKRGQGTRKFLQYGKKVSLQL